MRSGRFITFEGGEGVGKSTQVRLLAEALRRAGIAVLTTREPGGSTGAEEIRQLLLTGAAERWDAESEALLMIAARRSHLVATILPALAEGRTVLCDRFADSTEAYQGWGRGLPRDRLQELHRFIAGDFAPDLTLILDLPVETGLARAARRPGAEKRFERLDAAFHQRVRQGFLDIARREPKRCVVIDAGGTIAATQSAVAAAVAERLGIAIAGDGKR
ncbi:MAG TPA: dTMP kinase [Stellaceae bacterium]|nr:dTMP kinase [Stellaceae bacterium]